MQEKPKSIRNRNGFSEAMCEACERVLQNKPTEIQSLVAIESKAAILQRWASFGGPEVEKKNARVCSRIRGRQAAAGGASGGSPGSGN